MTKTIVVLGAGLVGIPLAHYLLSRTASKHSDIRVVLVSPNEEFYWKLASVRFIAVPALIPEEKYLFSIAKEFAKYPKDKFEFVLGKAQALDPATNSVTVALNDGGARTIDYHTVVIATGSRYRENMPWKDLDTSQQTRAAIARLQQDIKAAKSIVVAGAGVTGVEFAGELGSEFAKDGKKNITIVSTDSLPLESRIMESVRKTAKHELEKLGVKFVGGARITGGTADGEQQQQKKNKTLELTKTDGTTQTIRADLVIPTYGVVPNTEFAPESMRDDSGHLRQDKYLRAPGYDNVFVLGDAGNLQTSQAANSEPQLRHFMKQLDAYLQTGKVAEEYKFDANKVMIGLTIGRDRGTGQMGSMKPWSWVVWALKGRHIGTNYSAAYAAGLKGSNGAWP